MFMFFFFIVPDISVGLIHDEKVNTIRYLTSATVCESITPTATALPIVEKINHSVFKVLCFTYDNTTVRCRSQFEVKSMFGHFRNFRKVLSCQ